LLGLRVQIPRGGGGGRGGCLFWGVRGGAESDLETSTRRSRLTGGCRAKKKNKNKNKKRRKKKKKRKKKEEEEEKKKNVIELPRTAALCFNRR
jgi:hypothetical protein